MNWKNLSKQQQKNLLLLGLLALLGVALLLAGSRGGQSAQKAGSGRLLGEEKNILTEQSANTRVSALEKQLAYTLSQVEGAGEVTVQITVNDLGRKEYARDVQKTERNTSQNNGEGSQQTTEVQENQTVVQQGGALLVEESMPDIRGVLVVASGADSAVIQERLLQAAATVLQLSREKIIVLPGEGGMDHA